jgi:hypothetical protein
MRMLDGHEHFVDLSSISEYEIRQMHIVTASSFVSTHKGNATATFYQMVL